MTITKEDFLRQIAEFAHLMDSYGGSGHDAVTEWAETVGIEPGGFAELSVPLGLMIRQALVRDAEEIDIDTIMGAAALTIFACGFVAGRAFPRS